MSMVMSTAAVRASLSQVTVPLVLLKRESCLEKPKWL